MDVDMTEASADQKVDQIADNLAQYNLDNYDDEKSKSVSMGVFSNVKGLQYYDDPSDDPYVTLNDVGLVFNLESQHRHLWLMRIRVR